MGGRKVIMDVTYELLHYALRLPADIKVVGVHAYGPEDQRHHTDVFKVKLEGHQFAVVPEGGMIPFVEPTVEWSFE